MFHLLRTRPTQAIMRAYHCRFCHHYHFGHTGRVFDFDPACLLERV